jgi:hypothetical protein
VVYRSGSAASAIAVMVHTDMTNYPAVLAEAARSLQPGGVFVHVGVHPCFCGGFADRSDPARADQGLRDKVGATHLPRPVSFHAFLDVGLVPERFAKGGGPTPMVLALLAHKPRNGLRQGVA